MSSLAAATTIRSSSCGTRVFGCMIVVLRGDLCTHGRLMSASLDPEANICFFESSSIQQHGGRFRRRLGEEPRLTSHPSANMRDFNLSEHADKAQ